MSELEFNEAAYLAAKSDVDVASCNGQSGYFSHAQLIETLSVVTAACIVIKKTIYQALGRVDETSLKVVFKAIGFCLRVREDGY